MRTIRYAFADGTIVEDPPKIHEVDDVRSLTGSIGESSRDNCDNRRDAPQRDA